MADSKRHNGDEDDPGAPVAKVAPARKIISRGKDLLAATDNRLLALRLLGWRTHVFHDGEEPTTLVVLGVVDVSGTEPVEVGVVDVSWTRIVRLFTLVDPGVWQIGFLVRDANANDAVELVPPDDTVDLEQVARMLGPLQLATPSIQLTLPVGEQLALDEDVEGEVLVDEEPPSSPTSRSGCRPR